MSALTSPVLINPNRAYWLSSIGNDVIHSTITTQEIDANLARFSTVFVSDQLTTSSLNASSFSLKSLDLSEGYVSTLFTNNIYTSSQTWASDLSGGLGYVKINTDPSGVRVIGDPLVFGNLVYFTSTITIVPVSTLIDTDIFAQNGYFSTLSSGSISAGQLRANTAAISTLEVSSITTTDISGFEPETWSLYPTLNSSITFNGSNILSNVGNKLFFAGTEITDVSGGGSDWSLFPAQQDVSMNNFSIRQLSTLQYNDGARLYSQTGNNLFYNGQQISYGNIGSAANWSFYPASTNVNMAGFGIGSPNKLNLAAPQFSTVVDGGVNIASLASYDITAQNGNRGQINLTANGGFNNGLFGSINLTANGATLGGVGTGGLITLTANTPLGTACNASSAIKFSAAGIDSYAGAVPPIGSLAGYNFIYGTGGVNIASGLPSVFPNIPLTTYLYGTAGVTTESTFYVPQILPYWNGITTPPDLVISGRYIVPNLAQVYLQLSNVKYIYMDGAAQIQNLNLLSFSNTTGQITGLSTINGIPLASVITPSNIVCSNITVAISTTTNTLDANLVYTDSLNFLNGAGALLQTGTLSTTTINAVGPNTAIQNFSSIQGSNIFATSSITNVLTAFQRGTISSLLYNECFGVSSTFLKARVQALDVLSNINGISAGPPIQAQITNFSSIQSFNVSTQDFWCSSINGQPIDISGNPFVNINNYSTLFASSFKVSTMSGYVGNTSQGSTIFVEGGIEFVGVPPTNPVFGGRALTNLRNILSLQENLFIEASTTTFSWAGGINPLGYMRFGGGSAYDTYIKNYKGEPAVSTAALLTSSIVGHPTAGIDLSGNLELVAGNLTISDSNVVSFVSGNNLGTDFLINTTMPCFKVPGAPVGCNLGAVAANQFLIGSGTGAFGAAKLYCDFPGDNWGVDIIDANGTDLFETINCYDTGGFNFQTNLYGVSSIVGYTPNTPPGGATAVGIQGILTANAVSTPIIEVSTINGVPYTPGGAEPFFSTLFTSSFEFSTAVSAGSNSNFNFPLVIDYDQAGSATAGVGIAVQGHSFGTGAVINRIEMGARGSGENYIMSVWPGHNLEELFIDATDLTVRDGIFSTIINLDPFGLQTTGGIKGPFMSTLAINVSSINDFDGNPALTNNLMLSTMELYAASTTLMYWDSTTTSENINTSGYDVVVGINGRYKIGTSFQFLSGGVTDEIEFFVLKNDAVISQSGGIVEVENNQELVSYVEVIEPLVNGDKIQIGCYTANSNVFVSTINGNVIQSPAAILTMYKVD